MRSLPAVGACAMVFATCALSASPAAAQAPKPGERIAPGVTSAGVDLSNLTVDEAKAKLAPLKTATERPAVVKRAEKTFKLTVKTGKMTLDTDLTAKRALYKGRERIAAGQQAAPPVDVPLALSFSAKAVNAFAARVQRGLRIRAKDSTLLISLRKVKVTRSRPGRDIDRAKLAGQIATALANPLGPREFKPQVKRTRAKRNSNDVRNSVRTVITIDKSNFKLRLFKNLKVSKTYRIAHGQAQFPTPSGLFNIQSKQVNPVWSVPNSPWAGELGGTTVDGGSAANPLKARWMGVSGSIGIHGTGETGSIGTRASHGCIRMTVPDVIALFKRVRVGTPVLIR